MMQLKRLSFVTFLLGICLSFSSGSPLIMSNQDYSMPVIKQIIFLQKSHLCS